MISTLLIDSVGFVSGISISAAISHDLCLIVEFESIYYSLEIDWL